LLKGAHCRRRRCQHLSIDRAGFARRHFTALNDPTRQPEHTAVRATVEVYLSEFESLCHAVNVLGEASPRALDAISSLGERMSVQLIAPI
jgi:aspartokinase